MSMTDPIADFLTRIRNALLAKHDSTDIPASNMKIELTKILKEEGYIRNFKLTEDRFRGTLRVYLKYDHEGKSVIGGLKRVSTPGRRVFKGKDEIPEVLGSMGVSVISTSRGIMTDREARKQGVGGEVLCNVW